MKMLLIACGFAIALNNSVAGANEKADPRGAAAAATGHEARMYLRHAQDWAESLFFRSDGLLLSHEPELHDLVLNIERDVRRADKALASLRALYAKNADAMTRIARIEEQNEVIQKLDSRLATECKKDPRQPAVVSDLAIQMWYELDAADAETKGLLLALKLDSVRPPIAKPAGAGDRKEAHAPPDAATTYGEGFRPHTAAVYLRSALDNARALYHYAKTLGQLPDTSVREHLAEVERQLAALKQEYAKMGDVLRKDKKLEAEIAATEEQVAKARERVNQLQKTLDSRKLNPTELRQASELIYQNLRAGQVRQFRVMRSLGVQSAWHPEGMDPRGATYDPESRSE